MTSTPANWYADPVGRHQLRYWDGAQWTEHVSTDGEPAIDYLHGPATVTVNATPEQIQSQVQRAAGVSSVAPGGGTLFSEPILVVNQKARLIEIANQYAVFDQHGQQIASVNEVGQSSARKMLRLVSRIDQFLTHTLEIRDIDGAVQMVLIRPAKVLKSTVVVEDSTGREIGRIVQKNMIGKIHFALEVDGQSVGAIKAENWRAWNFRIEDATGSEVARITKTFEGLAKAMFTTADNYVVQIHTQMPQPLLSLVVASALSIDTALKQDDVFL